MTAGRRLLATDLDGTFIGNDNAALEVWADLEDAGVMVAFATGRHLASIETFLRELPTARRPVACITMVGTEIWLDRGARFTPDDDWHRMIDVDWDVTEVDRLADEIDRLVRQPEEWQSAFKRSFFLDDAPAAEIKGLTPRLRSRGVEAKIVYSDCRFLDIVPARSGKGQAVRHLAAVLDVQASNVVTAGDTGNDLDMMQPELGFQSIVVGNATPDLRDHVGSDVYSATASFAAGIREGLEHLGWLERRPRPRPG